MHRLLYRMERYVGIDYTGGWVGAMGNLASVQDRRIFCPYWDPNPDYSVVQPVI